VLSHTSSPRINTPINFTCQRVRPLLSVLALLCLWNSSSTSTQTTTSSSSLLSAIESVVGQRGRSKTDTRNIQPPDRADLCRPPCGGGKEEEEEAAAAVGARDWWCSRALTILRSRSLPRTPLSWRRFIAERP